MIYNNDNLAHVNSLLLYGLFDKLPLINDLKGGF